MTALASRCYDILLHTHSARNVKAESSLCSSCERTQFLIFPNRCHVTIIPIQSPEHCYSPSARVSQELPNSTTSARWKVRGAERPSKDLLGRRSGASSSGHPSCASSHATAPSTASAPGVCR